MWNQLNLDSIHCLLIVIKNNTVPLFPQMLMNVLPGEFSAHDSDTVSILSEATFAGVIKALIWCTLEANTNAMVITSYLSHAWNRAANFKIKLMAQKGMFLYYGWNAKQVVLHCFGILRKRWITEIDCERQGIFTAHILVSGSWVEASGENRAGDPGTPFQSCFFHRVHCHL